MNEVVHIAGAGLAGTLLALEAERLGHAFVVRDGESGRWSSRVAAGLFNPLLGPRMSADAGDWSLLEPRYREWESRFGVEFFHPRVIERPLNGSLVTPADFPRHGPGWSAVVDGELVKITGGGWVDLPTLLNAAHTRWKAQGRWIAGYLAPEEARGLTVVWCGGVKDFTSPVWRTDPLVACHWQAVRGDVLTVDAPECQRKTIWIGGRFLLPLGGSRFRWGATHVSDDAGLDERPEVRTILQRELAQMPGVGPFQVTDHQWGVRPSTRTGAPLIGRHATEPSWYLFNGFAGKGVSAIPRQLETIVRLVWS
jgi:glycine/D-amino acid oxidase-like deaminating enzyme